MGSNNFFSWDIKIDDFLQSHQKISIVLFFKFLSIWQMKDGIAISYKEFKWLFTCLSVLFDNFIYSMHSDNLTPSISLSPSHSGQAPP